MKSVGAMAIGRTFRVPKGMRALETGRSGWRRGHRSPTIGYERRPEDLRVALRTPTPERIFQIKRALEAGLSVEVVAQATGIDPWFLYQLEELLGAERHFAAQPEGRGADLRTMKRMGFSDRQLAALRGSSETAIREQRWALGVRPVYKTVDTCAGEFPSATPYLYSSYDDENESQPLGDRAIVILGSGPNRIGQGRAPLRCARRARFRELVSRPS
jgi:carbamoyl-phosphate synthase large subunit